MVSTHLKNISQIGSFPRDRGENNKIFETTTQEILKLQLTNSPNYVRLHLPLRQPSEQVERFLPLGGTIISAKQCTLIGQGIDTVDGRDPAPVVNIPLFTGFHTSQVVQDFLHQPYHLPHPPRPAVVKSLSCK